MNGKSKEENQLEAPSSPGGNEYGIVIPEPVSPSAILRKSLQLSPSWSDRQIAMPATALDPPPLPTLENHETTEDGAPTEILELAYFPLLQETLESEHDEKNDAPNEATVEKDIDGSDVSSEATVGGSVFSYVTAGGIWEDVPMGAPDAILGIASAYKACEDPNKVNVCVGAYRDEIGKPWVLPSVREAERRLWEENEIKEYLPIEGDPDFILKAMQFAYGVEMDMDHIAAVQTLSGTGACRIGGTFLSQFWPRHPIFVPNPTWGNHIAIFKNAGLKVQKYRYYDRTKNALDLEGMLEDIYKAPNGSIILLHACAHNPTGCDPSIEEWKQVISLISEKEHVAFFDSAYQGFAVSAPQNHDSFLFKLPPSHTQVIYQLFSVSPETPNRMRNPFVMPCRNMFRSF